MNSPQPDGAIAVPWKCNSSGGIVNDEETCRTLQPRILVLKIERCLGFFPSSSFFLEFLRPKSAC